jgi:hypothetical protein
VSEVWGEEWTVEHHLAGPPAFAVDLFHRFLELAEGIGPFELSVSKTTVTLKGTRRGFAGARPWRHGLRGYLDLQREVDDPRILSVAPYTTRLFVHQFRIAERDELDDEFAGWLREAYDVGTGAHLR